MRDVRATPFIMRGAREAMEGGLSHVEQHVTAIERAVVENTGLAFDLARTLIESTCRTVLTERSIPYNMDDDLPRLFRLVTQNLPFLPASESNAVEVRESLVRTLAGLHTAIQGICELRNQCTFASHGSDMERPTMDDTQALLAAEAADTIVGFLFRIHDQDRTAPPKMESLFGENSRFNESLDDTFGPFNILDIEFRPSEVLFSLEPESYRIYLAEFDDDVREEASNDGGTQS